jgi:pantothenate kinase-related protein Tda10
MHTNRNTSLLCLIHFPVTSPDSNMIQLRTITVLARAITARSVVKQVTNGSLGQRDPLANGILGPGGSGQSDLLPSSLSSLTHRILRQTGAYYFLRSARPYKLDV